MNQAFGAIPWPVAVMTLALIGAMLALWLANLKVVGTREPDALDRFALRLGAENWPRPAKLLVGALWAGIVTILLCGALFLFYRILRGPPVGVDDAAAQIGATIFSFTATIAALGAAVAFPFTLTRLHYTRRQVLTAEESLFNEKINAAATDLAARRQVTRVIGEGDEQKILTEWEDDIVTRAAAIDRLEGLVEENHAAGDRVARMLSIYVRELSKQDNLRPNSYPGQLNPLRINTRDGPRFSTISPIDRYEENLEINVKEWAKKIKPCRSDMEKAAQTLGRLQEITGRSLNIDLRAANLQGADLSSLNFKGAQFHDAKMEGAHLMNAKMQRALLFGAHLEGAILDSAQLEGANLLLTLFDGADLSDANLNGAFIAGTQFGNSSKVESVSLMFCAVKGVDLSRFAISSDELELCYGDRDSQTVLPNGTHFPLHWSREDLDALNEFYNAWRAWQRDEGYIPYDER